MEEKTNRQVRLSSRPQKSDMEYLLNAVLRNAYDTIDNYDTSNEPYYYKKGVVTGMWELIDSINGRLQILGIDKNNTYQEAVDKLEEIMNKRKDE